MGDIIYTFGFVVVVIFLLLGMDDLFTDIAHLFLKKRMEEETSIPLDRLEDIPQRLLGIVIAAWDEAAVIEQVVSNMVDSYHYPRSMYHIFVGTYPNDHATSERVRELEKRFDNVHMVVSKHDGPTNKADNINQILRFVKEFEKEREWEFTSITVHDSEDIVHPYELKLTNYLIDDHDAIQMPVFPLQREPKARSFFRELTRATYTAEFAENHYRTMAVRDVLGGIVPSAGTGFVLSRRVLDYFGDDLFPTGSLTEDYKLSLILAEHGMKVHYALGKVHRMEPGGRTTWDYVATRSIFPGTFRTAVRQKTRWVYGITMQSVGLHDIFIRQHKASFIERLSILKDLKAKLANLMVLPGYMVLAYFIASLFLQLPAMFPIGSPSFWLSIALSSMALERQYLRAVAVGKVYGWKFVVHCCLLPPLLPLSLVWGNVINFCATVLAWKKYLFSSKSGSKSNRRGRAQKWSKTDHEFPNSEVLQRFQRDLPDVLMRRDFVDADTIADVLQRVEEDGESFENLLLSEGAAVEEDLAKALATVVHTIYLGDLSRFLFPGHAWQFSEYELSEHCIFPLLTLDDGIVFAVTMDALPATLEHITRQHNGIGYVLSTRDAAITDLYDGKYSNPTHLLNLVRDGSISWEQGVIAVDHQYMYDKIEEFMGIHVPHTVVSDIDDTEMAQLVAAL